jgi:hypothetical protein
MNVYIKFALSIVMYCILMSLVCFWPSHGHTGNYVGNFERIRAFENRPPQVANWSRTPTVIICKHAPVTATQIRSAVKFWEGLDYKFNGTLYKQDPTSKCMDKNPMGYILIHMVTEGIRLDETSLAQTRFYIDNDTSTIDWAIIYMRPDLRPTVLEHELGHALGFLHFNRINHLMNQKWEMGGWDTEGLKNSRR